MKNNIALKINFYIQKSKLFFENQIVSINEKKWFKKVNFFIVYWYRDIQLNFIKKIIYNDHKWLSK